MSDTRIHYAFVAGLFASGASFFGKFTSHVDDRKFFGSFNELLLDNPNYQYLGTLFLRLLCLLLMVFCNVFVWTFFVKALHQSGGSLVATVLSMATNYSCSALIGCLIFGEKTSILWWLGTSIVILGILFILAGTEEQEIKKKKLSNKNNSIKQS